ncbi:MAG: Gfo/Idh/MocA family oxidoreductase [Acidobacteria bacterium]|nr:Gfo/Idh/MocA family oxidoreductase [Acidobacteriota bacterium]
MNSRRTFLTSAAGAAGSMAVQGANDRIRIGVIGPGSQGSFLTRTALKCAGTEIVAFADVYTKRLEDAKKLAPSAKTYLDHRYLLDDNSIDAVIIATPQHLHCQHFVAAPEAGKHIYQEKTMAFTVEHAKKMRAAYQKHPKLIVQIGHQGCSSARIPETIGWLKADYLGKITEVHAHQYRNTPHNRPQWSRAVSPDVNPENVIWKAFLGEAPERPFEANRYVNWRFFWDYSGGNYYENMCHQLASVYKILNLQIPKAVTSTGGVFYWKDGREVPDTMCTSMEHTEELLLNWTSGFGNNQLDEGTSVLGTDGSIVGSRYIPQKVNRPDAAELTVQSKGDGTPPHQVHVQNFLDCVRSGKEPNCPVELGFRVSIACRMAVDSLRQRRTLTWDAAREQIVS